MPANNQSLVQLHCHRETPCKSVEGIESCLRRIPGGGLSVTYVLKGNVDQLQIPPPMMPRRADGLWRHSCFEAFVAIKGSPAYFEFNFSPSGEWAAYAFRGYRDGAALADDELNPAITFRTTADHLELNAVIHLNLPQGIPPKTALRLGLSAVIEDSDGQFSYWALKHAPGKPDFHHADAFALEITARDVDATRDPAYNSKS